MNPLADGTKVLNGTYGKAYLGGEWLFDTTSLEINEEIEYEEVPLPGRLTPGQKRNKVTRNGTLTQYRVSRRLENLIRNSMNDDSPSLVVEIQTEIVDPDNPEMGGMTRIIGVQFQRTPGLGYTVGENVTDEIPFVFTDSKPM